MLVGGVCAAGGMLAQGPRWPGASRALNLGSAEDDGDDGDNGPETGVNSDSQGIEQRECGVEKWCKVTFDVPDGTHRAAEAQSRIAWGLLVNLQLAHDNTVHYQVRFPETGVRDWYRQDQISFPNGANCNGHDLRRSVRN